MRVVVFAKTSKETRKVRFEVCTYLTYQTFDTYDSKPTGLQFTFSKGSALLKRGVTSANLRFSGNMPFLIELFIISVNIGKCVPAESIRTFTGIQKLMADG